MYNELKDRTLWRDIIVGVGSSVVASLVVIHFLTRTGRLK